MTYQFPRPSPEELAEIARRFASKPAGFLFAQAAPAIREGNCAFCKKPVEGFTDALSAREFSVSGMCQPCQDGAFSSEED